MSLPDKDIVMVRKSGKKMNRYPNLIKFMETAERDWYGRILPKPIEQRFWEKVIKKKKGCWDWNGNISNGYGYILKDKHMIPAHRISYELHKGKIPEGLEIDHLCRNRICTNPGHLEAVTSRENVLRGVGLPALYYKQTHCKRGHELSDNNVRLYRGHRTCLKCEKSRNRKRSKK